MNLQLSSNSANNNNVVDLVAQAHRDTVDARHSTFNEIHGQQINISGGHTFINPYHRDSSRDRQQLANWLSPLNFQQTQNDIYASRSEGTCEWVFGEDKFKEWHNGNTKTLWCPGIQGAGKTVLASSIVKFLSEKHKTDDIAVAYIYCNYKDQARQTVSDLVANLLKQLVEDSFPTFNRVNTQYQSHQQNDFHPTLSELHDTLISEIQSFSRAFIIVDAVDEVPEDGDVRYELLRRLNGLGASLLVTSQDIVPIGDLLHGAHHMDIRAHASDIHKYVEGRILPGTRLGKCVGGDLRLRAEIFDQVVSNAGGMFLLPRLQMDLLASKLTRQAVKDALQCLPKEMDRAYDATMSRINDLDEDLRLFAINAIMWITKALRPLSVSELRYILAFSLDVSEVNESDLLDEATIVEACVGIVTVDSKESVFRLVHYTAQEYFEKYMNWPCSNPQAEITRVCLGALSLLPAFQRRSYSWDWALSEVLYRYAATNWGHHARGPVEEANKDMLEGFLSSKAGVDQAINFLSIHSIQAHPGDSALHLCAFFGLARTIEMQLNNGATVEQRDWLGQTPLHIAVAEGYQKVVTLLLDRGGDINSKDNDGQTPLSFAILRGRVEMVKMLLVKNDVDADLQDKYGRSPLSFAAEMGNLDVLEMLLARRGVDIDAKAKDGRSPLSFAAQRGSVLIMKKLLGKRAVDPDSRSKDGQSPLSFAAKGGSVEAVKILLAKRNVDPDSKSIDGRSPLSFAAEQGNAKVVKMLLGRNDVDADSRDKDNRSPLSFAAERGSIEIVQMLLARNGVDANSKGKYSRSPLSFAAAEGDPKIVEMLLARHEVDADAKDSSGKSPLAFAIQRGSVEVVQILLARQGVDVNSRDERGRSPLSFAAEQGNVEVVQMLLARHEVDVNSKDGDGWSPLSFAATNGREEVVKILLARKGVDADSRAKDGQSPLSFAAGEANLEIVKLLLGSDTDVNVKDKSGRSPLAVAIDRIKTEYSWSLCRNQILETIGLLLGREEIDVNPQDNDGMTPLMIAATVGTAKARARYSHGHRFVRVNLQDNSDTTRLLLAHSNIDVEAKDNSGMTALMHAAESECIAMVEQLLKRRGISVNSKNNRGMTPLMLAAVADHAEILHMLLSHQDIQVNARDDDGFTSLMYAAAANATESMQQLLSRGDIDVNAMDDGGRTALVLATSFKQQNAIEMLLAHDDVEVDILDKEGRTLLFYATANQEDISRTNTMNWVKANEILSNRAYLRNLNDPFLSRQISCLLLCRDDITVRSSDVNACMSLAFSFEHACNEDLANLLLERAPESFNVNWEDEKGYTALWLAVAHSDTRVVELLLTLEGVNVNIIPLNGNIMMPPLWVAVWRIFDSRSIVPKYRIPPPEVESLSKEVFSMLLARSEVDVNWRNDQDRTLLLVAAEIGNLFLVEALLARDDIDMNLQDENGDSPLHHAVRSGHENVASWLILRDEVAINLKNAKGQTPLHFAVLFKSNNNKKVTGGQTQDESSNMQEAILKLLLAHTDIRIDVEDDSGSTPLVLARSAGPVEVAKLLEDHANVLESSRLDRSGAQTEFEGVTRIPLDAQDGSLSSDGSESFHSLDDVFETIE